MVGRHLPDNKVHQGPSIYDVQTRGEGALAPKQMLVLINWVSVEVTEGCKSVMILRASMKDSPSQVALRLLVCDVRPRPRTQCEVERARSMHSGSTRNWAGNSIAQAKGWMG